MNREELDKILEDHKIWSESYGNKGSRADLSGVNLASYNLYGANLTGADLTGSDLSYSDLTGAYLYRINLTGANLTKIYLRGAYLSDANLTGANLTGAYLIGANLTGANLTGAYLIGADLTGIIGKEIITYQSNKHYAYYNRTDNQLKIGCKLGTLEWWLSNYEQIGKENNYTSENIKDYGNWIKSLRG